jgi:MoaA/NifB/PqqE/SkfB family radical SAM enzyme
MKDKKFFCYEIYKNLSIWSTPSGSVGYNPCSYFNGYIKVSDEIDISKVWNGPEHLALKQAVENDQPIAGCARCYHEEASGLTSRRIASKQLYEIFQCDTSIDIPGPQGVDYSVGNLCNLKCSICGPDSSTMWIPDYQKLHPGRSVEIYKHRKYKQITLTDPKAVEHIKFLHLHGGGEPLMSNNHTKFLEIIRNTKGLADVRVLYNTNGTIRASESVLELWSQCRLIELYFSIDDIGPRFEYQRTGAKWNKIEDNISWYKQHMPHNHMFNINCTWSYLNFYYLPDLVDWYNKNFSVSRYGDPVNLIFQRATGQFALTHISSKMLQMFKERFAKYPTLLPLLDSITVDDDRDHTMFWNSIQKLDKIRKQDFKYLCPEWSQLL